MAKFSVEPLPIQDVLLIRPKKFSDERGYFMEAYNRAELAECGITTVFVQDNQALSRKPGTVRGLHFQAPPRAQAKLVRVLRGAIFDVAVDLRQGSSTYGRWCGAKLSAEGAEQIFVPPGFAHGYCTLEPNSEVAYKVDSYYAPEAESGVLWNDPDVGVPWPLPTTDIVLADRDARLPPLRNLITPFSREFIS
jgi:dTDP-4-dehydrorhamnose 3,5-epimerase